MSNRGRHPIELRLDLAAALVNKIGVVAAAEQLGISRYTLRRKLNAAGITTPRPVRAGRKKRKFSTCDPPHSCFECPYPDCIRPEPTGAKPTSGELAFAAVVKEHSRRALT